MYHCHIAPQEKLGICFDSNQFTCKLSVTRADFSAEVVCEVHFLFVWSELCLVAFNVANAIVHSEPPYAIFRELGSLVDKLKNYLFMVTIGRMA